MCRRVVGLMVFVLWLVTAVFFHTGAAYASNADNFLADMNYTEYLEAHSDMTYGHSKVIVNAAEYISANMDTEVYDNFEGIEGKSIYTGESGYIEWEVNVPESGMYNIEVLYFPVEGKGNTIERIIHIDGKVPFKEARYAYFSRIWQDSGNIYQDGKGHDIRPGQAEEARWREVLLYDSLGFFNEPLMFYLEKGRHTIGFESVKEPVVLNRICIYKAEELKTYSEVKAEYKEKGYTEVVVEPVRIQAEKAYEKSDKTLYPVSDRSSAITEPQDPSKIRLNSISGDKWKMPRQWITWRFNVEEDGLYKIALRFRQHILSGMYVNRKIILDGEVPFKEAEAVKFKFDKDWQVKALGDDNEEFIFFLEKGEHKLTMEVTLGDLAEILNQVNDSMYKLNGAYRKILMITGPEPDLYRDYGFEKLVPDAIATMEEQVTLLRQVSSNMEKYIGKKGESIVLLDKISYQLEQMVNDPEKYIARSFAAFKENIGSLGTWILTVGEQPLSVDYITIVPVSEELPDAEASFLESLVFEIKSFVMSFFEDYNSLGSSLTKEEQIKNDVLTVWIASGRDQSQIIQGMINDSFTPKTNINVKLKLISSDTLLTSVLAGIGPDVALGNPIGDPIQYAIRNAVVNIESMPGYAEVAARFHPSALVPCEFEGKVYALPETQSFPMLFYRKDIFAELGINVPETWDDFYKLIPEIQKQNMQIGFPQDISGLQIFLYQNGGELYTQDRKRSTLDFDLTMEAFQRQIELFTAYKLPRDFDFANRFRTGEMPIGIANYTLYNQLVAFAPEIRGLWEFVPLPGTVMEDGSINRATPSTGTAAMMLRGVKDRDAAWKFMDWWADAEVQSRFAVEMESVLGQAAKQATSNMEALKNMPWTQREYENLMSQWSFATGTPEIPGGYYVSRGVNFAAASAYNNGDVEALLDYVTEVNDEIARKRREFGLE